MKQYAENACGTIALFHVILNSFQDYPDVLISPSKFTTPTGNSLSNSNF